MIGVLAVWNRPSGDRVLMLSCTSFGGQACMADFFTEFRRHIHRVAVAYAVAWVLLPTVSLAQWSIGQPGSREAPKGQNRYVYLVMSDPLPGREWDFNDAYQNVHMGDLVQLPGWTGAQRFRLVPDVMPRHTLPPYRRGNLIIWDQ